MESGPKVAPLAPEPPVPVPRPQHAAATTTGTAGSSTDAPAIDANHSGTTAGEGAEAAGDVDMTPEGSTAGSDQPGGGAGGGGASGDGSAGSTGTTADAGADTAAEATSGSSEQPGAAAAAASASAATTPRQSIAAFANLNPCRGDGCKYKAKLTCVAGLCLRCCQRQGLDCEPHAAAIRAKQLETEAVARMQRESGSKSRSRSKKRLLDRSKILDPALLAVGDTAVLFCVRDFFRTPAYCSDVLDMQVRQQRKRQRVGPSTWPAGAGGTGGMSPHDPLLQASSEAVVDRIAAAAARAARRRLGAGAGAGAGAGVGVGIGAPASLHMAAGRLGAPIATMVPDGHVGGFVRAHALPSVAAGAGQT